ncbi:hypothetical protein MTo_02455 [Microcystis aeruginosa NIES-1211]|jgi:uncharacterized protein (DUF4415 family)|uniref:Tc1-like transposase DDE domain-containing protein n=3 Tax=Microcystaceae TaxID=1890449 RepID=A0A5A5REN9_MICAE|nr:hypothetical protein B5D77_02625 [Microcystis sp. MC19]GBL15144.1 hypothetical protein MTo_02455 [Microcystis aeruginosa NIES-1211]GCA70826.1 hypothetical protein MiYa_02361 [Microcystis aeruginosa NIES-2519]GCA83464.1 hypothetical protein MiHa_01428 [Microcystis aeruginosa NIES-2522]CCI32182.1 conserved hypothetical protein [Microcystis sp. T1-4]
MDNAKIHLEEMAREIIEQEQARLIYLPPYSPEFSPIENFCSKVTAMLRKLKARTYKKEIKAFVSYQPEKPMNGRENPMSNPEFSLDMPLKERQEKFMQMSDEDIDYSDIPPLDDEFFKNAKLVKPNPQTEQISIRLDSEILEWFKNHAQEKSYHVLINDL